MGSPRRSLSFSDVEQAKGPIGDLEVTVVSPAGTEAILQQATGADPSNDLFRLDHGRLARWRLEIELE